MSTSTPSIAIAGAWGYIGRKFIDAGRILGYQVSVYDPGPRPDDVDHEHVTLVEDEDAFLALEVDLYHLALHPEHRDHALQRLVERSRSEPIRILNEKPMAAPESPQTCHDLLNTLSGSDVVVLFDFPELFDPITRRILTYLEQFDEVQLTEVRIQRSKDREDPPNPRNEKKMVPIQYQETVHCLAFVLNLMGRFSGSVESALSSGVVMHASSDPYDAPNPEAYAYVVDGRCDYDFLVGDTAVIGHTDFKRNAPWRKARIIRGTGDGKPCEIQVDYLEGAKYLILDGEDQAVEPWSSSYTAVLDGFRELVTGVPAAELSSGVYPNATFANYTYQLSSVRWRASRDGAEIRIQDAESLAAFDAKFAEEIPRFATYG